MQRRICPHNENVLHKLRKGEKTHRNPTTNWPLFWPKMPDVRFSGSDYPTEDF
jgi:hypothetical protein